MAVPLKGWQLGAAAATAPAPGAPRCLSDSPTRAAQLHTRPKQEEPPADSALTKLPQEEGHRPSPRTSAAAPNGPSRHKRSHQGVSVPGQAALRAPRRPPSPFCGPAGFVAASAQGLQDCPGPSQAPPAGGLQRHLRGLGEVQVGDSGDHVQHRHTSWPDRGAAALHHLLHVPGEQAQASELHRRPILPTAPPSRWRGSAGRKANLPAGGCPRAARRGLPRLPQG